MTTDLALDPDAALSWLKYSYTGTPGLLSVCSTLDWAGRTFARPEQAVDYIARLDERGPEGIYIRVGTLRGRPGQYSRGGDTDTWFLPYLWADLDIAGPGHKTKPGEVLPPDREAVRQIIAASGLPEPTGRIHSGGGDYGIWMLDAAVEITAENLARIRLLSARWQVVIARAAASLGWHYGVGVGDLSRVLRAPGTVNRKAGLERPCVLLDGSGRRYTRAELRNGLVDALGVWPDPVVPQQVSRRLPPQQGRTGVTPNDDFEARVAWDDELLLRGAGWTIVRGTPGRECYWKRPGKDTLGHSATTGRDPGRDRLYVFSTDSEFPALTPMTKPFVFALLHHGGDTRAATRALVRLGFGTPLSRQSSAVPHQAHSRLERSAA